jgi:enoyl-CoA hydratase/carnithine racemase
MDLALGCDIRIASDKAKLSAAFTKRGVLPESGGTWLLPRIVGWSVASEIMFTGRKLDAQQCLDYGIVNRVVPADALLEEVGAMAAEIAGNAPLAVQATKRMMRMAQDESFEANVHHVFLQLLPLFRSNDFREGVSSFLEKRPPKFEGS